MSSTTVSNPGFSPKKVGEAYPISFNFKNLTDAPSAPVFKITRLSGTADPNPAAMLAGSAQIIGTKAVQLITGGVAGTRYLVVGEVDAPGGAHYILDGVLEVTA